MDTPFDTPGVVADALSIEAVEIDLTQVPHTVDIEGSFNQSVLFDEGSLRPAAVSLGYRGTVACAAAGITYRQLDYWARTGLAQPSIRSAAGSGTQRLYSFGDILILRIIKRLIDTGVSLPNIRTAVEHLNHQGGDDLARITLMSDGATIYECRSSEEVIDLVRGGQGVFGIAVGRVWAEVEGTLSDLPGEDTSGAGVPADADPATDELAARRLSRRSAS
ncbi:MAG: MerR family transcriptional regulator [Candidatus Nanopelagicales bacterium]